MYRPVILHYYPFHLIPSFLFLVEALKKKKCFFSAVQKIILGTIFFYENEKYIWCVPWTLFNVHLSTNNNICIVFISWLSCHLLLLKCYRRLSVSIPKIIKKNIILGKRYSLHLLNRRIEKTRPFLILVKNRKMYNTDYL